MVNEKLKMKSEKIATAILCFILMLTGCKTEDDTIVYKASRRWVEKTVAVVAPLNDPIMKARLERTAAWMLQNLHNAQLHDTLCIDLKVEWYDEYGNDLKSLGKQLASRDDLLAVIGPFDSDNVEQLAPCCQQTGKTLILPTATSETVIRRFAITSSSDGQQPFLWSLTETDISLSEVMLSIYANRLSMQGGALIGLPNQGGLFAPAGTYGQTFIEWAPFQAAELGIDFKVCEQYADDTMLYQDLRQYLKSLPFISVDIPEFIVVNNVAQLYQIARIRSEWRGIDPDDPSLDESSSVRVTWSPVYYACSNITEEAIAALGPRGVPLTHGYQGFSPYADPMSGFEMSYETRYGTKPTFAECKFYDALLLVAFAASYMEHRPNVDDMNNAIIDICTTDNLLSGHAWSETGMELYLSALEQGQLFGFKGASGPVQFDSECYTAALNTTYVNWMIDNGRMYHRSYYSAQGNAQTSQTLASWNYLMKDAEKKFDSTYDMSISAITYPALTDQYAVLVQGSNGWENYRHEADVLSIYQLLKAGGYDDDHIILITADDCANAPENSDRGAVRTDPGGRNLREGAVIDYRNSDLTPQDICNILQGVKTDRTPVVLPTDAGQNVLLFWSGHGHSRAVNGINEMGWCDLPLGEGMTARLLTETLSTMAERRQFRQMLVCLEPCYSANMGKALEGIPGVLAICSAGAYEQSFADSWSNELGIWMCDRFSRNLVGHATEKPDGTYRDLYLYCAQHTLGSHVGIYNYMNFGNLYTNGPKDFFIKNNQ
jgi:glycosylphosphatidylinositol transamidase (GPIT) subunit GPI8